MIPIAAVSPSTLNIWTKLEFEARLAELIGEEQAARKRFNLPTLTDDQAIELTHMIVRDLTVHVLPAGSA